jgi:hypothetical protein
MTSLSDTALTALFQAISRQDEDGVRAALHEGANPNALRMESTPYGFAVDIRHGLPAIVDLLEKAGGSPNAPGCGVWEKLVFQRRFDSIGKLLEKFGYDPVACSHSSAVARALVARQQRVFSSGEGGPALRKMADCFLKAGLTWTMDTDQRPHTSLLHELIRSTPLTNHNTVVDGLKAWVDLVVRHGFDVNFFDEAQNISPVIHLAMPDSAVSHLLALGANPCLPVFGQLNPVIHNLVRGHASSAPIHLRHVLEAGETLMRPDKNGKPALMKVSSALRNHPDWPALLDLSDKNHLVGTLPEVPGSRLRQATPRI